jgi:hypothetical protein
VFYTTSASRNITWFNHETFSGSKELQVRHWYDNSNDVIYFVVALIVALKLGKANVFLTVKEEMCNVIRQSCGRTRRL